jgi:GT2 family glycosyltransferase
MTVYVPKFSVVIASHGRAELLVKLLESLKEARMSTDAHVEILIVDSTPAAKAKAIQKACAELGVILINGPLSVRCKRNLGASSATGDWLFFVDSDCEVSQEIFNIYRRAIDNNPEFRAGAGPTIFRGGETSFTKLIQNSSLLSPFRQPIGEKYLLWATTSNLLVRKDVFDALNGFRENFPFRLGGDDTDFCLRLRDASYQLIAVPEATCFHSWTTWSNPFLVVRRSFRWGWMHSRLLLEYPHYRRIDAPSLPLHTLMCALLAFIGVALTEAMHILIMPVLFVVLAVMFHAFSVSVQATKPLSTFLEDIVLAIVELPFGFGRAIGALASFSLVGVFFRLDANDVAAYKVFPETARSLLCDNAAFLCAAFFVGWMI